MRQVLQCSVILLLVAAMLSGCKSNSTSSNNPVVASTMSATINGKAWKSDGVVGFRYAQTATPNLQFEGWVTTPFVQIPFNVSPAITAPGTYPLVSKISSLTDNAVEVAYNTDTASFSDNVTGSVTITLLTDHNAQGTFAFKAIGGFRPDTVIVTNGQFNVPLQ